MRQMKYLPVSLLIGLLTVYSSCKNYVAPKKPDPNDPSLLDWLIPKSQIINRGIKDSIHSIDNPVFAYLGQTTLNDNDLVIGVNVQGEFRVYPEKILGYHEVVNDVIKNKNITLSYSPLTGTSLAWDATNIKGITTTFSPTTYLYNCNNILFDKTAASYWQQIYSECVAGNFQTSFVTGFPVVETSWANWKSMFPGAKVLAPPTGYKYNYSQDPFAGYTATDSLYFLTTPVDKRLPLKEKVLGLVVGGRAKVYRFSSFADSLSVVKDNFQGLDVVVAGSQSRNFMVCYERRSGNNAVHGLAPDSEASNIIMADSTGTRWDIFGTAVDGPLKGQKLNLTYSMMGYWFAFGAMYPDALIY